MKLHVLMKHCNCCVHLWLDFHGAYCAIYMKTSNNISNINLILHLFLVTLVKIFTIRTRRAVTRQDITGLLMVLEEFTVV